MVTLTSWNNWRFKYLDVRFTFLNGKFKEEVCMLQPKRFEEKGGKHLVCKIKVFYGLEQALGTWYS
jgi:hypothetical protein